MIGPPLHVNVPWGCVGLCVGLVDGSSDEHEIKISNVPVVIETDENVIDTLSPFPFPSPILINVTLPSVPVLSVSVMPESSPVAVILDTATSAPPLPSFTVAVITISPSYGIFASISITPPLYAPVIGPPLHVNVPWGWVGLGVGASDGDFEGASVVHIVVIENCVYVPFVVASTSNSCNPAFTFVNVITPSPSVSACETGLDAVNVTAEPSSRSAVNCISPSFGTFTTNVIASSL